MKSLFLGVFALACMPAVPALASDCEVDHFSFVWGTDTQTHMTVKSGKSCKISVKLGRGSGMRSSEVSQPAQNGTVASNQALSWQYRSRTGYTGKDAFVVQASGESMGGRGTSVHTGTTNLAVDVDVVP